MRAFFEARPQPSRLAVWMAPVLATGATLVIGFIVFEAFGKNPLAAFYAFFIQPVATRYGVAELLLKATPLMLIATGLAIGYRANVWNIGAEGQLTLGAMAGADSRSSPATTPGRRSCCCLRCSRAAHWLAWRGPRSRRGCARASTRTKS